MRFTETVMCEEAVHVDREKNQIRGVRILGQRSANGGRVYSESAMRRAERLYDGAKVFYDHDRSGAPRTMTDLAGDISQPYYDEHRKAIYGTLNLIEDSRRPKVFDGAERFKNRFGLSHVADGDEEMQSGKPTVTSIENVISVDIVTSPATNHGLFEDMGDEEMSTPVAIPKKTYREIISSTPEKTKHRKRLVELEDAGMIAPEAEVEVAPESSPEEQIKKGLMAAIIQKLETDNDLFQQVLDLLELDPMAPTEETPTDEPVAEDMEKQSTDKLLLMEAKIDLLEADRDATPERVAAVASASKDHRTKLIESWPKRSNPERQHFDRRQRPDSSPPIREDVDRTDGGREGARKRWEENLKKAREKANV